MPRIADTEQIAVTMLVIKVSTAAPRHLGPGAGVTGAVLSMTRAARTVAEVQAAHLLGPPRAEGGV